MEAPVSGNGITDVLGSDPIPAAVGQATDAAAAASDPSTAKENSKWPGWPGDSVFRLIVPVLKVGSIIGRKGELVKRMCEETRARIRILEGAIGTSDRIVLISGKEEPDAEISPAIAAVLRVFKRVNGIPEDESDGTGLASTALCSVRLLVSSSQAINIIGKQGSVIKSIQESTGASMRVLTGDELPFYVSSEERILEIQGESLNVLTALQASLGHLRKFLVDHSVIPLFEKTYNASAPQDRAKETWADKPPSLIHTPLQTEISSDYPLSFKRESLFLDRETQVEHPIPHTGLSLYGQDPPTAGLRSSGLGRSASAFVTQVTQTMQIPLSYAEDIIGVGGVNIAYIRRTSGATLTVQESRGLPDEITVEIKGTSTQVQTAQQLIQNFIAGHKEPVTSTYGKLDTGLRSYSQLANTSYPSSSLGGYGSSGVGGYGSYRV
ncbi:hypothetical protein MRB53_027163 [Persea americana]|uniref:Uncharacterized protein n=1 Tax=Persea americana TaxID=3435 RepID=A0ACC2LL58_PERAE|nr:hypothetical protein MRB53_027163 [Persea americana]